MKYLLSLVILAFCLTADAATVWNRFTTNVDGTPINGGVLTNLTEAKQLVNATPFSFYGFGQLVENTNNPVLTNVPLSFSAQEIRDQCAWYARGSNWILYTGSTNGVSQLPYRPEIGIASSPDGINWTDYGMVIATNSVAGRWNSGAVFSPCVYYDPATDILRVFVSGTTNDAGWVGGPIQQGIAEVAAGLSWTDPASYVWMNNNFPIIPFDVANDGDGEYSSSVIKVGSTWELFASTRNNVDGYRIALFTNSTAQAPYTNWTRVGAVVDHANYGFNPEEPCVVKFPNGYLGMFLTPDTALMGPCQFMWTTNTLGLNGWTVGPTLPFNIYFEGITTGIVAGAGNVGSPSAWQDGNGQWWFAAALIETNRTGEVHPRREIGVSKFTFNPQHSAQISDYINANVAVVGTRGFDPNFIRNLGGPGGLTNFLGVYGDIVQGRDPSPNNINVARTYRTQLQGPMDLEAIDGTGTYIKFSDRTLSGRYLFVERSGNTLLIGSSVDFALRGGSGDSTTQTNRFYMGSDGAFRFVTPVDQAPIRTNLAAFNFTPANPGNWYTGLGNRVSNTGQRATLELDLGFVDAATGTPVAKVVIEQGLQITNTWTCSAPGTVVSTITNHFSFRLTTNAVVIITDISRGSGASVTIANSQLTSE